MGLGSLSSVQAAGSDSNAIIWVDSDGYESTDGGQYMLTSVVKEMGNAVFETIKESAEGSFSSDPYVGTLANEGVSIAPYHDWDSKVTPEVKTRVEELKQQIIDGTLDVSTRYDPS